MPSQVTVLAFVFYALGLLLFAWRLVRNIRNDARVRRLLDIAEYKAQCFEDCDKLAAANERIHEFSNSLLRGFPVVKFRHPEPVPANADHWYYRIRMENLDHLFTEEAVREARRRAELLIPPPPKLTLRKPPT